LNWKITGATKGMPNRIAGPSDSDATNHVCWMNSRHWKGRLNIATNVSRGEREEAADGLQYTGDGRSAHECTQRERRGELCAVVDEVVVVTSAGLYAESVLRQGRAGEGAQWHPPLT
jgi:hypothetical protein